MKAGDPLVGALRNVEPPRGLLSTVLACVARERRKAIRIEIFVVGAVAFLSGVGLVPALYWAAQELYLSGFYEYLSLITSDRAFIISSWQEFGLTLIESIPSLAVLAVIAAAGIFCYSIVRLRRDAPAAFKILRTV